MSSSRHILVEVVEECAVKGLDFVAGDKVAEVLQ